MPCTEKSTSVFVSTWNFFQVFLRIYLIITVLCKKKKKDFLLGKHSVVGVTLEPLRVLPEEYLKNLQGFYIFK